MGLDALGDLVLVVGADLNPAEQALQGLPAAAQQAAAGMESALSGVNGASGLENQLQLLNAAIGQTGEASRAAVSPVAELGQGFASAGEQAGMFGSVLKGVISGELIVDAIEGIAHALKDVAENAIEAFSQIEKFQAGMTQLTGSSEAAAGAVRELSQTAASAPFGLEELARAQQRMTAFGISTSETTVVMKAAMDASAATGNSFNNLTNALERVEVTGSISARQLNQLGVSWEDLAKTAGVSVAQIQEDVKKGGQGAAEDLDLLVRTIQTKFSGASAALADTISGQMQIVKNQIALLEADIGSAVAPVIKELAQIFETDLLPAMQNVVSGLKALAAAAGPLGGSLKAAGEAAAFIINEFASAEHAAVALGSAIGSVADLIPGLSLAIRGLGSALSAMALAIRVGQQGYLDISAAGANATVITDKMRTVTQALTQQFGAHISETGKVVMAQVQLNDALTQAQKHLDDVIAAQKAGKQVQGEYAAALDAVEKAQRAVDPIGYAAKIAAATQAWKEHAEEVNKTQAATLKAASAIGQVASDIDGLGTHWNKYFEAYNKIFDATKDGAAVTDKMLKDLAKATDELANGFDKDLSAAQKYWGLLTPAQRQMLADLRDEIAIRHNLANAITDEIALDAEMAKESANAVKGVLQQQEAWQVLHKVMDQLQSGLKDIVSTTNAWDHAFSSVGITANALGKDMDKLFKDGKVDIDAMNAAWNNVIDSQKNSIEVLKAMLDKEVSAGASLETQLETRKKILELQLKQVQEGQDVGMTEDEIRLKLQQITTEQQVLTSQASILADAWKGMAGAFTTAFHSFSQGIGQAIVEGKSFGDTMTQVVKKLAEDIISLLVETAMKELLKSLIDGTSLITNMASAFSSMLHGFHEVEQAATTTANTVQSGANSAMSSISSTASGALGIINTIASVVTAVFGILSYAEERHMAADLTKIEKSTRYSEMYLGESGDSILSTVHEMLKVEQSMDEYLKAIAAGTAKGTAPAAAATEATPAASAPQTPYLTVADLPKLVNTTVIDAIHSALGGIVTPIQQSADAAVQASQQTTAAVKQLADANQQIVDSLTTQLSNVFSGGGSAQSVSGSVRDLTSSVNANTVAVQTYGGGRDTPSRDPNRGNAPVTASFNTDQFQSAMSTINNAFGGDSSDPWGVATAKINAALAQNVGRMGLVGPNWDAVTSIFNDLLQGDFKSAIDQFMRAGYSLDQASQLVNSIVPQGQRSGELTPQEQQAVIQLEQAKSAAVPNFDSTANLADAATSLLRRTEEQFSPDRWADVFANGLRLSNLSTQGIDFNALPNLTNSAGVSAAQESEQAKAYHDMMVIAQQNAPAQLIDAIQRMVQTVDPGSWAQNFANLQTETGLVVQGLTDLSSLTQINAAANLAAKNQTVEYTRAIQDGAGALGRFGVRVGDAIMSLSGLDGQLTQLTTRVSEFSPEKYDEAFRTAAALLNSPSLRAGQPEFPAVQGTPGYLMSQGDMAGAIALATRQNVTNLPGYATSGSTSQPTIVVNVNAGTVVGSGGMTQLANQVGNVVVDNLRRANMRF